MAENSNSGLTGPEQVEQEFLETLRQAAFLFQNEKNGRFQGSILACRAVVSFIYQRDGGAELAGPFLQIAEAATTCCPYRKSNPYELMVQPSKNGPNLDAPGACDLG